MEQHNRRGGKLVRILVDREVCTGHARCAAAAPDLFLLDDVGYSAIVDLEVPFGSEEAARLGADACPERAITLVP